MGQTNFDVLQANQILGPTLPLQSPFGKIWYIDGTNGSDGNTGKSPAKAFASIGAAISASVAGRGDTIIVAPGTYTITAALSPKAQTVIRAAMHSVRNPTVKITSTTLASMVTVDADNVQFFGIEFLAGGNTVDNLVNIAATSSVNGCSFHDCVFNGADKTTVVGILATHATNTLNALRVVNCLFRDLTGTCISIGVQGIPYGYIGYNQFAIDVNSGVGIALADTTAFATGKGYVIEHNVFTGFDATADEVGITIAGTEDTTGAGIIRNNYFAYMAAAAITIDKLSKSEVNNYYGDAATGGTLVDPGT